MNPTNNENSILVNDWLACIKVSRIAGATLLRHRLAGKYPTHKNA